MNEQVSIPRRVAAEGGGFRAPEVGEWYWVGEGDEPPWLGCAVLVGSNFVKIEGPGSRSRHSRRITRVHFDNLNEIYSEPNPERYISEKIEEHQGEVRRLLERARALTAGLAIKGSLPAGAAEETQALALRGQGRPVEEYKTSLLLAKDETLPKIFEEVKLHNETAACWMEAFSIPLEAQAETARGVIEAIENRIFNVELYAGLVEQIEQVKDGEPPAAATPIHLMQRRAYMDEECLARYEVGGMELKDIRAFDAWISRPENMGRLLPHQRCVLAMRVRRREKKREAHSLTEFIKLLYASEEDKYTFLYLRNGGQLFRLRTGIEFNEQLFPDSERIDTTKPIYFEMFAGSVKGFISEAGYQALLDEEESEREKDPKWTSSYRESERYTLYSPESVYYDEATRKIHSEMAHHNRLVLVLQGLLDRSPTFHTHPPWHLWDEEDFRNALRLVHDDSRALTPGEAPDFEAYRVRLNRSLEVGSIAVGQEDFWLRREGKRESERLRRDWRYNGSYYPERYRPLGDPGPGRLARVAARQPRAKRCKFTWERESRRWSNDSKVHCAVTVPDDELLNVSAYTPGDFRQFFDDPRTRADYLEWAPLLLEAEEYHAGNRKEINKRCE